MEERNHTLKIRKMAKELLEESGAVHAAYGLETKNKHMGIYGIRQEIAEDEREIKLFFDDESFNKWSDELIKEYQNCDIEIRYIYAVHKRP